MVFLCFEVWKNSWKNSGFSSKKWELFRDYAPNRHIAINNGKYNRNRQKFDRCSTWYLFLSDFLIADFLWGLINVGVLPVFLFDNQKCWAGRESGRLHVKKSVFVQLTASPLSQNRTAPAASSFTTLIYDFDFDCDSLEIFSNSSFHTLWILAWQFITSWKQKSTNRKDACRTLIWYGNSQKLAGGAKYSSLWTRKKLFPTFLHHNNKFTKAWNVISTTTEEDFQ